VTTPPCPVCGGAGDVDCPELAMLQCTCRACGWHYSLPSGSDTITVLELPGLPPGSHPWVECDSDALDPCELWLALARWSDGSGPDPAIYARSRAWQGRRRVVVQ
jgi:hypothetical protein